jgi:hypothetical protein
MADVVFHMPDVRDKSVFLNRMMTELAGNAYISLEGNLARCRFADELVVTRAELGLLKRSTLFPRQNFVVLRLAPETVAPISKQVSAAGLAEAVIHVQIERDAVLELAAYDNFAPGCVITGPGVTVELLEELRSKSVIRDFDVQRREVERS